MDYFYLQEADQFNFIQVPMLLFTNPFFKDLSSDAKLLYGLLLSRMQLSRKNGWIDEEGRVYINYPIEEIQEVFSCGSQKAVKILSELDTKKGIGLVEKKRLGLGKSNVIYVKNFATAEFLGKLTGEEKEAEVDESIDNSSENEEYTKSQFLNCENQNSGIVKITTQEFPKSQSKYIDNIYINNKYNNLSINPNNITEIDEEEIDRWTGIERDLISTQPSKKRIVREIIDIVKDILLTPEEVHFTINEQKVSASRVKTKIKKLDYEDIVLILQKLEENTSTIINIRAYITAMLYNSSTGLYYEQLYFRHQNS